LLLRKERSSLISGRPENDVARELKRITMHGLKGR
jgi:hypothetical protein